MYVDNSVERFVGKEVILTEDKMAIAGGFTKGTRVKITEYDDHRGYTFEDKVGNRVIEAGWSGFELI